MVWSDAKIFLCLWHVKKAWAENVVKQISSVGECTVVLQMLGDIMYGKCCNVGDDPIDWAVDQIDNIFNVCSMATTFMRFMNEFWLAKTPMWCVGTRRIPHA